MSQEPKKYLFSMKSLLVMCLLIALFGALNTIERSRYEGAYYRGFPLMFSETVRFRTPLGPDFYESALASMKKIRENRPSDSGRTITVNFKFTQVGIGTTHEGTYDFTDIEEPRISNIAPLTTFNTLNLVLNLTMGIGLSALLAFACEREVFRRFRAGRSVEWRPTGPR